MKLQKGGNGYLWITLSRRNLLSLLHKLDMPGSARELIGPNRDFSVCAEDDKEHYANRLPAGRMHPQTEKFIERAEYDRRHRPHPDFIHRGAGGKE